MSTWKADGCVGTVRLLPGEASELVAGIVEGLTHLADRAYVAGDPAASLSGDDTGSSADFDQRLQTLEARLGHPRRFAAVAGPGRMGQAGQRAPPATPAG